MTIAIAVASFILGIITGAGVLYLISLGAEQKFMEQHTSLAEKR